MGSENRSRSSIFNADDTTITAASTTTIECATYNSNRLSLVKYARRNSSNTRSVMHHQSGPITNL